MSAARPLLLASAALLVAGSAPPPASAPGRPAPSPAAAAPAAPAAPTAQPPQPAGKPSPAMTHQAPGPRFPGFAAWLGARPAVDSPFAWKVVPSAQSWAAIVNSTRATRQQARWDYARSLIGSGQAAAALGVLEVIRSDDPDTGFLPAYALARGAALEMLGRADEALSALGLPELAGNPEACAWRLRAFADAGRNAEALRQVGCALPALKLRSAAARIPFILAGADAATGNGHPEIALRWLASLPKDNPAANLARGRASIRMGKIKEARAPLAAAERNGDVGQRYDARVTLIEARARTGGVPARAAIRQLGRIAYQWRGDAIEERALRLRYQLAAKTGDLRSALESGATLVRYFRLGSEDQPMLASLQGQLLATLAPDSKMPLDEAAGLYWDYRDLTPSGAAGDYLVSRLGERLQAAGLYGRAAELLEHQLLERTTDIAQGPLSARVATLHILAGRPDRALDIIRKTDNVPYPPDMLSARLRVEAVALTQIGKTAEALAILQSVPEGGALRQEIFWRSHDWAGLAATAEASLPPPERLSEVSQTMVLRQAIALAMLGREPAIARLRARYSAAFATLPSANLFDLLTRPAAKIDPTLLDKAMAGLPSASPAGEMADLLDA